jgi:hypothetical protein
MDELYERIMVIIRKLRTIDANPVFHIWSYEWEADHTSDKIYMETLSAALALEETNDALKTFENGTQEMANIMMVANLWTSINLSHGLDGCMTMEELDKFVCLSEILINTREMIEATKPGTDYETN